jgi:hypothetical protein
MFIDMLPIPGSIPTDIFLEWSLIDTYIKVEVFNSLRAMPSNLLIL